MAGSVRIADMRKEHQHNVCGKSQSKKSLVAAIPKHHQQKALNRIINMDQNILGMGTVSELGFFLLKLAVLEGVRRFSKAHCPFLWRGLQALQFVCLPPLRWIQKWGIFRGFINFTQALSRPMLILSVATSLSDRSNQIGGTSGTSNDSQSRTHPPSDSPTNLESADSRRTSQGAIRSQAPEKWMSQLYSELEKEGMALPERITEDDLLRFYKAANRDFSCFLTSVKKTILWRQNFRFLSVDELEGWSEIVFWHGHDIKGHPCLIIRLAPACSKIISEERSRLPEVVVSQIEYGILHLVRPEDPLVTVLMDCEGLTPFRFPVHMMRSCAILLQDHYPNRLAALFVVRLAPVARVIAQTLFQVLRPGTRQKLRIVGEGYERVLSKHLQTRPSFLGGDCSCPKCTKLSGGENVAVTSSATQHEADDVPSPLSAYNTDDFKFVKCNRVMKTIIVGLLLLFLCIIFVVRIHDLSSLGLYR